MEIPLNCCNPWNAVEQQRRKAGGDIESLAQELTTLSVQERNQINDEIHGVAAPIIESPEMITEKISALKMQLGKTSRKKRKDLDRAFFLRPSLEDDNSFYLMFLRAKRFDVKEAAASLCAYFTNKKSLFGIDLLVEKITLEHLTEAEKRFLKNGAFQILKNRESRGRNIFISNMALWDTSDLISCTRSVWYVLVSLAEEDEELQKNGFVSLGCMHGEISSKEVLQMMVRQKDFNDHWPVHTNSVHIGYDDPTLHIFMKGMHSVLPKHLRIRQRLHFGSIIETKHALMSFGINVHDCFEQGVGTLSSEKISQWLEERKAIEDKYKEKMQRLSETTIISPRRVDVLIVKSAYTWDWPGNIMLNRIVKANLSVYASIDETDRFSKTVVTMDILQTLKERYASRFLERTSDGWQEASESAARAKVGKALRDGVKSLKGISR